MAIVNATVMIAGAGGAQLAATAGPTFSLDFTIPGTLPSPLTFTRASTATYFDATGLMVTAAVNAPRWDYDPVGLSLKGLLLEDASSNQNPSTISAAGGWTASAAALTAASGIAPDGTNTMTKLTETATTAIHVVGPSLKTITAASAYTFSVYAKAVENRYLQLVVDDNSATGVSANYDLLTGTICLAAAATGSASLRGATIQPVGNGIYRCALSLITSATATVLRWCCVMQILPTTPKFGSYTGVAGRGLLLWGAQLEPLTYATSFIPTTTPPVSRATDSCGISAANMGWFTGSPGGSWYVEFDYFPTTPTNNRIFGRPNFPGGVSPASVGATNFIGQYDGVSGLNAASPTTPNTVAKVASTWTVGQAQQCTNGSAAGTSAALTVGYGAFLTSGLQLMPLGPSAVGDNCSGHIRLLSYWSRVLPVWEMQGLTGTTPLGGAGNVRATAAVLVGAAAAISGAGGFGAAPITPWPAAALIAGIGGAPLNYLPNPRCQGAVPGTPGTLPTNWGNFAVGAGITQTVVGTGIEAGSGLPYVDVRYSGAPTSPSSYVVAVFNLPLASTPVFAANTPLTLSVYMAMVAGSMANINDVNIQIRDPFAQPATIVSPLTATLTRYTNTSTIAVAAYQTNAAWGLNFPATPGLPVDITLRFGPQQLEIGTVATAQIYPPVGQVALAARGIIAINDTGVRVQANAQIDGVGGQTNWISNPRAEGAIVGTLGSGGAVPTQWVAGVLAGTTAQVVATGVEDGLPYVDYRVFGTIATNSLATNIQFSTPIVRAAPGEVWTSSLNARLIAGAWPTAYSGTSSGLYLMTYALDPTGATVISYGFSAPAIFVPTNEPLKTQRFTGSGTAPAGTGRVQLDFWVYSAGSTPFDFTVRLSSPQMERGPVTPSILPPVGNIGFSTRGLLAMPFVSREIAAAGLGGVGSVQATAGVLRVASALIAGFGGRINYVPNPNGEGGTVGTIGSGGVPPTGYSYNLGAGLTLQYLGQFTAAGIPLTRWRYFGTASDTAALGINPWRAGYPGIVAGMPYGATLVESFWHRLVAGSTAGMGSFNSWGDARDAINTPQGVGVVGFTPGPNLTRLTSGTTFTVGPPPYTIIGIGTVFYNNGAGSVIDFTIDIGGWQLEILNASSLILPPVGAPGQTRRGVEALPYIPNYAAIAGVGSVQANGLVTRSANARINGVGGGLFAAAVASPANARIDGRSAGVQADGLNTRPANATIAGVGSVRPGSPILFADADAQIDGVGSVVRGTAIDIGVANAQLNGAGGVRADGLNMRPAGAQAFAGIGNVRATGVALRPASAQIDGTGGQTNWIRNPNGDGAAVGGDLPTYWSTPLLPGLAVEVTRTGIDPASGLAYVDIHFLGNTFVDGNLFLYIEPSTYSIAAPGDTFTTTAWFSITGSLANISQIFYNASIATGNIATPIAPSATFARYGGTGTLGAGATAIGLCYFQLFVTQGAVDITLRLGGFQLERGALRTPLISPEPGDPEVTTRALLAMPTTRVMAAAEIDGQGGIRFTQGAARSTAAAEIDGQGHLAVETSTPGRAFGGALIGGRGGVLVQPFMRYLETVTIHGTGSVRASPLSKTPAGITRLVGVGKVQASTSVLRRGAAKIQGTGQRAGRAVAIRVAEAAIHGLGTLRPPGTRSVKSAAARIVGIGGVSARGYDPLAVIRGAGHVTALVSVVSRVLARISGAGSLGAIAGSVTQVHVVARIDGVGSLNARAARLISASARINGAGYFECNLDASRPGLAAIRGVGHVTASARVVSSVSATIRGAGHVTLDGTPVHQIRQASATINGTGGVRASGAFRGAWLAAARIDGVGRVRASTAASLVTWSAAARINGTGKVGVKVPTAITIAGSTIHGVGKVRASAVVTVTQQAISSVGGIGRVHATAVVKVAQQAVSRVSGAGKVVASATRAVATAARIAGTGLVRALATGTVRVNASVTIHGAGGVRAFTRMSYPVSATIHGTGGIQATAGVVQHALARIAGLGGVRALAGIIRHALARIAGLGQLRGDAIKPPKLARARINGTGGVHATAGRGQPEDLRINGRGSVTARPGALRPASATINGIGRVRAKPAVQVHVRVQIHGLGTVIADPDLKSIHHAVARIEGEGGVEPDPFIPRDRVALYGVHLPATKRGVLV